MSTNQPKNEKIPSKRGNTDWRGILVRVAAGLFVVLVLTLVTGFLLLRTKPVRDRIRHFIETSAGRNLNGTLEIEAFSGNLVSRICLEGIQLKQEGELVLAADRLCVDYLLPRLFGKVIHIEAIRLKGMTANLVKQPDGTWNALTLKPGERKPDSAPRGEFVPVAVGYIGISDGNIRLEDKQADRILDFRAVQLGVGLHVGPTIRARIRKGAFTLESPSFRLSDLQGDVSYDRNSQRLNLGEIRLTTQASDLAVSGEVHLSGKNPQFDLTSRIHRLALSDLGPWLPGNRYGSSLRGAMITGDIKCRGNPDRLYHELDLNLDSLSVQSKGVMTFPPSDGMGLDLSAVVRGLDPTSLPFAPPNMPAGQIGGEIRILGKGLNRATRHGKVAIKLNPSELADYEIYGGEISAHIEAMDLPVFEISLNGPLGKLSAKGSAAGILDPGRDIDAELALSVKQFNPTALNRGSDFGGLADLTLRTKATVPVPVHIEEIVSQAELRVTSHTGDRLAAFGVALQSGRVKAEWNGNRLCIQDFSLHTQQGSFSLRGSVEPKGQTYQVDWDAHLPDLEAVVSVAAENGLEWARDIDLSGGLSVSNRTRGTGSEARLTTTVSGRDIKWDQIAVQELKWNTGGRIYRNRPQGGQIGLTCPGRLCDDFGFDLAADIELKQVSINGHGFSSVSATGKVNPHSAQCELSAVGEPAFRLSVAGNIDQWLTSNRDIFVDRLQVTVAEQTISNEQPIHVVASDKRLTLSALNLISNGARATLEGHVELIGDGSSASHSLRATVTNLDLQRFSPYWRQIEPVDGIVSFHVASTGPLKTPRMETKISVSQGTVFETPFSRASLIGSYDDGQIKGEVVIQRQGEEQLVLSGTFDALIALHPFTVRPEKDPLDALVRINDLPLALLPIPTSGKLTYDGLLSATVSVTGRATAPKLRGQVALHKGSVRLSNPPLRYDRVEAMVRILPEKLVLQRVYAEDSKVGHLNLQGTLDHQDFEFTSVHLALTGQDSHIPFHRAISATVNPDLMLTGPVDAPTVKGRLVIEKGMAHVDKFLADQPSDIEIVRGPQEEDRIITLSEGEGKRSPLWDGLTIDMTVTVPRNFWIKGRDKNIELSGEMKIKKAFQDPIVLIGDVDTVRGTYEFRDKLFRVTRGKIAFVGLKEPNPNLDIETVTRIKDVDIILRIVGTAKQPELVLDSRPPMPEADIVSYLVFGRPTDGATTQQAFKAEETALNITGKLAANTLEDILADTFHLDALYIDPGENSFAEGSLSLGKYVSPRVFVTYEHRFQESESPELEISYEINRNLEIETQVGNEETTGADLIWEHEF